MNIRSKFYIFVLNFYSKTILQHTKKVFNIIRIKIELLFLSNNINLELSLITKLSHILCVNLFNTNLPDHFEKIKNEYSQEYDKIYLIASKSNSIRNYISDYYNIFSYYYVCGLKTPELEKHSEDYYQKALQFNQNSEKLKRKSYDCLVKRILSEYKSTKKVLRYESKNYVNKHIYSELSNYKISTSSITFLISFCTTIFLLSGFLYNKFYLGHFKIQVSHFFSITDYISSSVDIIYISCLSTIFGIFSYICGGIYGFKKAIKYECKKIENTESDWWMLILVTFLALSSISMAYYDLPRKYAPVSILIFIALMGLYHKLPVDKIFKNTMHISIFACALIYYTTHMYFQISSDIEKSQNGTINKQYSFNTNNPEFLTKNLTFLSLNSKWAFFFDKSKKESIIIPIDKIRNISIK